MWSLSFLVLWIGVSVLLTLPLRWVNPDSTAFMRVDERRAGKELDDFLNLDQLSDNLKLAIVAAEDQRFDQHRGLDLQSIMNAIEDSKDGGRLRGASTLTQQLAKNLYLWPKRSIIRKGLEAWLAMNLELFLPKRRILELYLNVVEFGPGIYGADEAARYFFRKPASSITAPEAALLAAVLPSPRRFNAGAPTPYVRERQAWIETHMARMQRQGWLINLQ